MYFVNYSLVHWSIMGRGSFITTWTVEGVGVSPNDLFITYALFSKSNHEGGGGSKIPKILTTWFMDYP